MIHGESSNGQCVFNLQQNALRFSDEPSVSERKKSKIRIASYQPEEVRNKLKKLYKTQRNYLANNIETNIKVDKLVFT